MSSDFNQLIRRLELAQARQNERFTQAAGARSLPIGGGFAHFRGEGHPLNQALGLVDPISERELAGAEAFLGQGGHPVVLELSPGADPELWFLLARRGYRLGSFQQLLTREISNEEESDSFDLRLVGPEDSSTLDRVLAAGFQDRDEWRDIEAPFGVPVGVEGAFSFLAFVEGEPAGGCTLGLVDGIALLSGDAVLPRFRGRGIQKALIRHRLNLAAGAGVDLAIASTLPSTPSQRAYERNGFRVAYPKVEMVKVGK